MRASALVASILVAALVTSCARSMHDRRDFGPGSPIGLADALRRGAISRVDVVWIPRRVLTRTRLSADALERSWEYRLTIREFGVADEPRELASALERAVMKRSDRSPDCRYGILIYDGTGARRGSVFLSGTGREGLVDGAAVELGPELERWIARHLPATSL